MPISFIEEIDKYIDAIFKMLVLARACPQVEKAECLAVLVADNSPRPSVNLSY